MAEFSGSITDGVFGMFWMTDEANGICSHEG
jgi:hypothetical protein